MWWAVHQQENLWALRKVQQVVSVERQACGVRKMEGMYSIVTGGTAIHVCQLLRRTRNAKSVALLGKTLHPLSAVLVRSQQG